MKPKVVLILLLCIFINRNSLAGPKIFLKLDDLFAQNGTFTGKSAMDYLLQKEIKFSYGIIADRLDNTSLTSLAPYINAVDSNGHKLLEIWNHGLEHTCTEYSGKSYEYQKLHFDESSRLVQKYLGIQMHTFGSPCNANDSITIRAMYNTEPYRVFFLNNAPKKYENKILYLNWPRVEIENGTGNPDFSFFVENYITNIRYSPKYMILQGHPNQWTNLQLEQFKLIVDYLIDKGCEFVLPYDYYLSLQVKSNPILQAELITSKQVILSWFDNDNLKIKFKIERSEDSINWENIGTNNEISMNYFVDNNILTKSGNYYYRIQPNIGIKTLYSNVVHVADLYTKTNELTIPNDLSISVFPIPSKGEMKIKISMKKPDYITIDVYNLSGLLVKRLFSSKYSMGDFELPVNTSIFESGIYFCKIKTTTNSIIKEIIINNE